MHIGYIGAKMSSQRVPRKNMRIVGGETLLCRSINTALNSNLDDVVVYGDDSEVLEYCKGLGAKICLTPEGINDKKDGHFVAIAHALEQYPSEQLYTISAACPLATSEDINICINMVRSGISKVVSVVKTDPHPYLMKKVVDGIMYPFVENSVYLPIEYLPECFSPNGFIGTIPSEEYKRTMCFLEGAAPYEMPAERSVDINTEFDIKLAEFILTQ